ncbi:PAS domain S-box protein [Microscilla marina ATCC 23134]|uniref:PAS domain S-box protein n=2 Tax=Microscilla marina TaxID=1027 RepID=A1ZW88_MICM2|nr:PAS domain S-box protein [Microscilla marina ATCC 23134]
MLNKNIMKEIRFLGIFLLILTLYSCQSKRPAKIPAVINGVIDLQNWDFEKYGSVKLDGTWEFYWKHHLVSQDFTFPKNIPAPHFITVPDNWYNTTVKKKRVPLQGFATYRVKIRLPKKRPGTLGLKFPVFRTSGRVFIDSKLILETGTAAKSKEHSRPEYKPCVVEVAPDWSELQLIIQVSNFHYRKSGIINSIALGQSEQLAQARLRKIMFDMLLAGMIFFVGIYHISIYWLRRKSKEALYFGVFCLLVCFRILSVGERPLLEFVNVPWFLLVKMEFFGFYSAVGIFTLFCYSVFPQVIHRIVVRINMTVATIASLLVIFTPPLWFSFLTEVFQIMAIVSGVYIIYALIKSEIFKQRYTRIFLLGWVVFFTAVVHDILFANGYIKDGGYVFDLGFLFFILCQTYVLTLRFSLAFTRAELLTDQLDITNKNLEKVVAEKTESLVLANQHLSDRQKTMREHLDKIRTINDRLTESSLELRGQLSAINRTLGFVEISPKGKILEVNSIFCYVTGYERESLIGRDHQTLISTEEYDQAKYEKFWSDLVKGIPASGESKFIAQNKTELWFSTSYTPIIDQQGLISKIILLTNDITAQKLQNLEFETQYKAVNQLNATVELDLNGRVIKANDLFLNLIGYSADEIQGLKHHHLLVSEMYTEGEIQSFWQELLTQESKQGEFLLRTKNGENIWLAGAYNVVKNLNGEPQKILTFARDVSRTKRIAQEYKQLSLVASKTNNAVMIANERGVLQWVNQGFIQMSGYSFDEAVGKTPGELMHGEDTDEATVAYLMERIGEGKEASTDIVAYKKNGEKYWVNLSAAPVYDDYGQLVNFVSIEVDITERKALEEEILRAKERTETMYAITSDISGNLEAQLSQVLEFATRLLGLEVGIISKITENEYQVYSVYPSDDTIAVGQLFPLDKVYCEITLREDKIIAFHSVLDTPYSSHPCYAQFQTLAYIGVPVRLDGEIFGTLSFSSTQSLSKAFSQGDKDFILLLAEWIGGALSRLRYEQTLKLMNEESALMNTILNEKNELLDKKNKQVEKQNEAIQEQYHVIKDSIEYAERIQRAILPPLDKIQQALPNSFIYYRPRDLVSGDFYWFAEKREHHQNKNIIAVVDCTGHGVPGAFMSMIGTNLLNQVVHDKEVHQPNLILQEVHRLIRQVLHQNELDNNDGMDIGILTIDKKNKTIDFAGAKHSLLMVKNKTMTVVKGDRLPLGGEQLELERTFKNHQIPYPKVPGALTLYLTTDGYQDQFGGQKGRKFMTLRFRELLENIHQKPMAEQYEILHETLDFWMNPIDSEKKYYNQIDDILVMGISL